MRSAADTATLALHCLDLTELSDTCGPQDVGRLLKRANTPFGPVAAVCVWPQYVSQAAEVLRGGTVRIATVINFPAGGEDLERALDDAREALRDGANEIDLVLPYKALMRGEAKIAEDLVATVADGIPDGTLLKVILETGELAEPAMIERAARLAISAGAHFLKTSTGKTKVSATPEAATILLSAIRDSGKPVGFKASGGIRTLADARLYLELADSIMGPGWATPQTFRIGASGLLDALTAVLGPAPTET
jgi:deoxyribose-phosphate aldolase